MEVPGSVKPGLVVETRDVYDQRIPVPVTDRPPHPGIVGTLLIAIHVDGSTCARKLVGHENVLRSLKYLKWIRHVRGAWHARQVALDFRVSGQPVLRVLFLFRRCRRQIGNLVTFHHPQSCRNAEGRTYCDHWSHSRRMILDIPTCCVESLPNPV